MTILTWSGMEGGSGKVFSKLGKHLARQIFTPIRVFQGKLDKLPRTYQDIKFVKCSLVEEIFPRVQPAQHGFKIHPQLIYEIRKRNPSCSKFSSFLAVIKVSR